MIGNKNKSMAKILPYIPYDSLITLTGSGLKGGLLSTARRVLDKRKTAPAPVTAITTFFVDIHSEYFISLTWTSRDQTLMHKKTTPRETLDLSLHRL